MSALTPTHHPHLQAFRTGVLQVSLAGVLWGTGGLALQLIREQAPLSVLTLSTWRMGLAALALLAVLGATRQLPGLVGLLRRHPGQALLVGAGTAAYQALYFASVVAVGVSVATVISLGLAPVLVTAGEAVAARRRPSGGHLLTVATALVGLLLVAGSAGLGETGPHPVLGVLAAVASGATYAATTVLGRPLARSHPPVVLTTAMTAAGTLSLLPFAVGAAVLAGPGGSPLVTADPVALGLMLYLGLATMALAYLLLYAGLRHVPGSAAVVASLLEPVTAAALAAVLLGERIGVAGVLGTLLILAAVVGLSRQAPPEPPVAPPA